MARAIVRGELAGVVESVVNSQKVVDMHTHLYPPAFGTPVSNASQAVDASGLMLWGVDELVTYHYLIAEVFRVVPATVLPYEQFWKMSKQQQADHIWKHLFVERTPISEACRGVLTALHGLGIDTSTRSLIDARKYFASQDCSKHIDRVMEVAGVEKITMTNAVFDDNERNRWLANPQLWSDSRFSPVLRIDTLLVDWPTAAKKLAQWGYRVNSELDAATIEEAQKFLRDWIDRTTAIYIAASLPPDFSYPAGSDPVARAGQTVLEKVVLPVCEERGLAMAMMIGSKRGVNPALGDAADMVGHSDIFSVTTLCRQFPRNKFFLTMLSRENQHEMCIAARKFGNLMIFGCWWFLNNPSLIEELTRMRLETLGTSMIPQHSDARVLDQLLYKWNHSRQVITKVLVDKYADILNTGWTLTDEDIKKDVKRLFKTNFEEFVAR